MGVSDPAAVNVATGMVAAAIVLYFLYLAATILIAVTRWIGNG
jgi:hypothetical protein